ncbi:hypothetical protein H0I29_15460 [Polaribacter sp. R2A056_3_33]|uniref:hypothetical protein n=1 Tax=Polaribacter sp. R2A056_3_33 TaxID=2745563 RepID=UPI001C4E8714|nr:hypothetical protein [Polaribacter sp. R2A056_3_33]QXP69994.1 hypothetical protein H0I29_15460 [Polaribacter sp. R2A056_3_33]
MLELKKNPFKPNVIENNPTAFGLRTKEIVFSITSLLNDNSIFITGSRGIGKSSLGLQLQKVMSGNETLLKRCNIKNTENDVLCIYYACAEDTTIEDLCLDILYELEQEILLLPKIKLAKIKPSLELNFGIIKAKFETEIESNRRSPSSIANRFVNGLRAIYTDALKLNVFTAINIMIDEVDQLPTSINFGHFIKIIHETLNNRGCNKLTFLFAGQLGSYTRFNKEDPSFERIVKCITLDRLSWEASNYILDYASATSTPKFEIKEDARKLILSLSSGYPYIVHLIGDSCFNEMSDDNIITKTIVLSALEVILLTDKREKFTEKLRELNDMERELIFFMASQSVNMLPAEIPYNSIYDKDNDNSDIKKQLDLLLNSLITKGYLYSINDKALYIFSEELFRIFVSYIKIELSITKTARREFSDMNTNINLLKERLEQDEKHLEMELEGEYSNSAEANYVSPEEKKQLFNEYISSRMPTKYSNAWEEDNFKK